MNILHIDCSPRHDSHSRRLSAALLARLRAATPDAGVTRRDLGREPGGWWLVISRFIIEFGDRLSDHL